MNQVIRGIDFELQQGNPGALGLFFHAAQGGTVQDVTVRSVDAFAAFGGGGGAGASHANIAAIGGQYGVFFAESEAGPIVIGSTFLGQTKSALVLPRAIAGRRTQGPLLVVGCRIVLASNATGPAVDGYGAFYEPNQGAIVVDTSIDCNSTTQGGDTVRAVAEGAYLKNVWTHRCEDSLDQVWSVTHEAAVGPMWSDAACSPNATIHNTTISSVGPSTDLYKPHIGWREDRFPSWEDKGTADAVRDCGAKGDGVSDDVAALQGCLDTHKAVFIPKGIFRLSATLRIPGGGSLVGLSQTHSVVALLPTFPSGSPLVSTVEGAQVTLAFLGMTTFWHNDGVFTLDWRAQGGLWRNNYETRVCECMWLMDYGSPNTAHGNQSGTWPPSNCTKGVLLAVPKTQIRGTGRFYNYVSDEDILMTEHKRYRHLLVANNSRDSADRTTFYSLNLEHGQGEAQGEFRAAAHVDVFGHKKEGSSVNLWIRDSADINIYYSNGRPDEDYTAVQNVSQYPPEFDPYTPSLFRIERTSPLKLVGFGGSDGCGPGKQGPDLKCKGAVPCHNYPMGHSDLVTARFPTADWANLLHGLWQPWCGYTYQGANQVVEADGFTKEIVATTSPGAIYMRGHGTPQGDFARS